MVPGSVKALRFSGEELIEAVDRERELAAKQLHDSLSQTVAAVALIGQLLQRGLERDQSHAQLQAYGEQLGEVTQEAMRQVRQLALRWQCSGKAKAPEDDGALATDLECYVKAVDQSRSCVLEITGEGPDPEPAVACQILRIAQEAIDLVPSSEDASGIELFLRRGPDALELEIRAAGLGRVDLESVDLLSGAGLLRLRSELMGAELETGDGRLVCRLLSEGG